MKLTDVRVPNFILQKDGESQEEYLIRIHHELHSVRSHLWGFPYKEKPSAVALNNWLRGSPTEDTYNDYWTRPGEKPIEETALIDQETGEIKFEWSDEQVDIYDFVPKKMPVAIQAVAGSGKSAVLFEFIRRLVEGNYADPSDVLVLSFNKKIAEHAQSRVDSGVVCKTFHSHGLRMCNKALGRVTVENDKVVDYLLRTLSRKMKGRSQSDVRTGVRTLSKIIGYLKVFVLKVTSKDVKALLKSGAIARAVDFTEPQLDFIKVNKKTISKAIPKFMDDMDSMTIIDYTDMVRYPALHKFTQTDSFKYVFVDEAQDMSKYEEYMIDIHRKKGAIIVSVGDDLQSIYEWRGASGKALSDIIDSGVVSMPLTTTYRCKSNIADWVAERFGIKFVGNLQGGVVESYGSVEKPAPSESIGSLITNYVIKEAIPNSVDTMVIARYNYILVGLWVDFLELGYGIGIKSGFKSKLQSFINSLESRIEFKVLSDTLYEELDTETSTMNPDMVKCVLALTKRCNTYRGMLGMLKTMEVSNCKVEMHTVHSAKGLEASTACVVHTGMEEETDENRNLFYVATTRALDTLKIYY